MDELEQYISDNLQGNQDASAMQAEPTPQPLPEQPDTPSDIDDLEKSIMDAINAPSDAEAVPEAQQPIQTPAQEPVATQPDAAALQRELEQARRELIATQSQADVYKQFAERMPQQEQPAQQQAEKPVYERMPYAEEDLRVDPELEKQYSESSPFIQAVARQAVQQYHQQVTQPLVDHIKQLESGMGNINQGMQQSREQAFISDVQRQVPDVAEITQSNEWKGFIAQHPRYSGNQYTYADMLRDAGDRGNVGAVVDIIADFKASRQQAQGNVTGVSPGRSNVAPPPTTHKRANVLKMSDFENARAEYQSGQRSYESFERISNAFMQATAENRVDYNR